MHECVHEGKCQTFKPSTLEFPNMRGPNSGPQIEELLLQGRPQLGPAICRNSHAANKHCFGVHLDVCLCGIPSKRSLTSTPHCTSVEGFLVSLSWYLGFPELKLGGAGADSCTGERRVFTGS